MHEPFRLKRQADAENEIHDAPAFEDLGVCVITPIATFPDDVAMGVVRTLASVVSAGHARPDNHVHDRDGIVRAQRFEEGDVFMIAPPFEGYSADRYVMDFYDVQERDLCSRMHFHTGMRLVRIMTGPQTTLRISTLSEARINHAPLSSTIQLRRFTDNVPKSRPVDPDRVRFNVSVPSCTWVDMQIPRGTAHQFNAIGPNAVIDTVHPEESIEVFRERIGRINMMAQTIFLEEEQPAADACLAGGGDEEAP